MAALSGENIGSNFRGIINLGSTINTPLSATLQPITDGEGNASGLKLSTTDSSFSGNVGIGTNTPSALLNVQNSSNGALLARFKDNISASTYLDIKTDPTLTDYTALYFGSDRRIMSKQGGALFLSCGDTVSFVDGLQSKMKITPTELQVGAISGARVGIKGSGTTSATTSLLVQNSAGNDVFSIKDNGLFTFNDVGGTDALTIENGGNISRIRYNDNLWIGSTHGTYSPTIKIDRLAGFSVEINSGSLLNLLYATGNLGIGETTPTARLQVKGSGTTSSTTALLVQNSAGTQSLKVDDSGLVTIGPLTFSGGGFINGNPYFSGIVYGPSFYIQTTGAAKFGSSGAAVASAILEASSTTRGFLPPRMTTTQKNAIATPASGLVVYDTDTNKLACYNGTTWNDLF